LIGSETAIVEFLAGGDQVEDDPGQFVRSGGDCLGSPELGSHPPIEVPKGGLFLVYHAHERRRLLGSYLFNGLDVGPHSVIFQRADLKGNIWLMDTAKSRGQ